MEAKATAGKKVEKCEKQISQSKWLMCWVPIVKIRKRIAEVEKSIESIKAKKQENETRVSKRDVSQNLMIFLRTEFYRKK